MDYNRHACTLGLQVHSDELWELVIRALKEALCKWVGCGASGHADLV